MIAGFVVVLAALGFWWLFRPQHFFDMKIYVSAVRWWLDGHDLYDYAQPDALQGALYFTYPPFAALLMAPLGLLPLGTAQVIMTTGTIAAVALTSWLLVRAALPTLDRWPAVVSVFALVMLIEPTRATISFGQINMWLVALIMVDLLLLLPRGSRWAGVGIGLATAIKLTPGLFIVYLLVTRRWRAAAVAAGTAAGVTLVAALIAPDASRQFWFSAIFDPSRVGRYDYTSNQSIMGVLARLTAPEKPAQALWLVVVAVVAVIGMWRASIAGRGGNEVAGLALTGLTAGLISPISWLHHLYWFVPALVTVAALAIRGPRRTALVALLIGGYAVLVIGVDTFVDWGTAAKPTATAGEFLARNAFALLAAMLIMVMPIRKTLDYTPMDPK